MRSFRCILVMFLGVASTLFADDFVIICPYVGQLQDVQNSSSPILKDNALLKGFFVQGIGTDRYQWNTFLYQSSDINYSDIWGGHLSGDIYFMPEKSGEFVIGAGSEYLFINTNAGDNIIPLQDFLQKNYILVPYGRVGYRFRYDMSNVKLTALPWVGTEYEDVWGSMSMMMPGVPGTIASTLTETGFYALTGLNVHANFYHAFELEAKYFGAYDHARLLNNAAFMANVFLNRHVGLSYRFEYMQTDLGSDRYNMLGLAYML